MDFLEFRDILFRANTNIGRLYKDVNNILGEVIWYDTFEIKNSKWLWLVNDNVAPMKKNCGSFGL